MKKLLSFMLFIIFLASCEKETLNPRLTENEGSVSDMIQASPPIDRWKNLKHVTNLKLQKHDENEVDSKKFRNKYGEVSESEILHYIRPNNSIYTIQPIRKKGKKVKALLVSLAKEGDNEIITFIADKNYLKSNELGIRGELRYNLELFLKYFEENEVQNRDIFAGLPDGCFNFTECSSCLLGGFQVQETDCSQFQGQGEPGDPYGHFSDYPFINDATSSGGGGGPGGPGNNGGSSLDNKLFDKEIRIATQDFIDNYNLSFSIEDLVEILGLESYEYVYLYGFYLEEATVNEDNAIKKLVEYLRNQVYSAADIVDNKSPYGQINDCERPLVWGNPVCASKIAGNYGIANLMTHYTFGYNEANECSDAFRHGYFAALNAASCGVQLAKDFGDARECTSDSDLAEEMDLFNNLVGYSLIIDPSILNGLQSTNPASYFIALTNLRSSLCSKLSDGDLKVFDDPNTQFPDNGEANLISSNNCNC